MVSTTHREDILADSELWNVWLVSSAQSFVMAESRGLKARTDRMGLSAYLHKHVQTAKANKPTNAQAISKSRVDK
jgi:hypothetical protein